MLKSQMPNSQTGKSQKNTSFKQSNNFQNEKIANHSLFIYNKYKFDYRSGRKSTHGQ